MARRIAAARPLQGRANILIEMAVALLSTAPDAHVAQSVEHFLGKEEVMDSSSIVGSISFRLHASGISRQAKAGIDAESRLYVCSSVGRAADSKSAGRGFESLHTCQFSLGIPSIRFLMTSRLGLSYRQ